MAARDQGARDLVRDTLCAAALRAANVTPVENQDAHRATSGRFLARRRRDNSRASPRFPPTRDHRRARTGTVASPPQWRAARASRTRRGAPRARSAMSCRRYRTRYKRPALARAAPTEAEASARFVHDASARRTSGPWHAPLGGAAERAAEDQRPPPTRAYR